MFWELYFEKKAPISRRANDSETLNRHNISSSILLGPSFGKCIGSDWIESPDTSVHSPGVSHGECSAADSGLVSRPSFAVGMTLGHQIDGGSPQSNVFGGRKVLSFSVCESEFAQACGHGCCSTGRTSGRTVDRDCGGPAATSKTQNFRGCQSHIFPVFPSQHPTSRLTYNLQPDARGSIGIGPASCEDVAAPYGRARAAGDCEAPLLQGHAVPLRAHQPGRISGKSWECMGYEFKQGPPFRLAGGHESPPESCPPKSVPR